MFQVEGRIGEVDREILQNQRDVARTVRQQGELEGAHTSHKNRIRQRNSGIVDIVRENSFSEFMGIDDFMEDKAEEVLSKLLKVVEEKRTDILTKKDEFEKGEAKIQSEIDALRTREAALDHDIKSKGKQMDDMASKVRQVKQKLRQNENELSTTSLEDVNTMLAQLDQKIIVEEGKLDPKKVSADIEANKRAKREIEHKLVDIKDIVNKMNREAKARSEYDIHVKEKKDIENKIGYLKRKHADELEHLLGEVPEENLKHKMEACSSSIRSRITDIQRDIERLSRRKVQLDTNINNQKQQLERKEKEVKDLEGKIYNTCKGVDLDTALDKSKKLKEDLTRERGDLSSSITVLNRFVDKLKQRDCCPLCHRDFGTKDEVNLLIEELESKVTNIPGKLNTVKEKLDKEEKQHDQMIQLKPQRDQANYARIELNKIQTQMSTAVEELSKIDADLESKREFLDIAQSDEETARSIQPDIITIENHIRKVGQLKDQIDDLQATLGTSDGGMSMDEAINRQTELEEQIRKYQNTIEDLQEQLQAHKDRLQGFKDRKLRLSTQALHLQTKLQETENLKEEVAKLEEDRKSLGEEREKAQGEVAPFKYDITKKTDEKRKATREKDGWIDAERHKVNLICEKHRSVNDLQKSIMSYISAGQEDRLKENRERVTTLQDKLTSLDNRKKAVEEQNRNIQKELSNQRQRKRSLDDEKKIRDKEIEAKHLEASVAKLEERIRGFDWDILDQEKNKLSEDVARKQNKVRLVSDHFLYQYSTSLGIYWIS